MDESIRGKGGKDRPSSSSPYCVVVVSTPKRRAIGRTFAIGDDEMVFGRSKDADIPIDDGGISREHAKIIPREDGYYLVDLDSKNGTYLDGNPVRVSHLTEGSLIRLGSDTILKFTPQDALDREKGEMIGRYELLRRIGSGGMAAVWKASIRGPAGFKKFVAIKKVLPEFAEDPSFVDMFVSEARLVARLLHPNIVQVLDFGQSETDESEYYLVMEYVPGRNLGSLLARFKNGPERLPLHAALYIALMTARALSYAHALRGPQGPLGVVHRDVSPSNVLLSYHGDVKVADFGIAKVRTKVSSPELGVLKGKRSYMAPEQRFMQPVDARSDLFSLGAVIYEMVTNQRLFGTGGADQRTFKGFTTSQRDALPSDVADILDRALNANPDLRFQEASMFADRIAGLLGGRGVIEAPGTLAHLMQDVFRDAYEAEIIDEDVGGVPSDEAMDEEGGTPTVSVVFAAKQIVVQSPQPADETTSSGETAFLNPFDLDTRGDIVAPSGLRSPVTIPGSVEEAQSLAEALARGVRDASNNRFTDPARPGVAESVKLRLAAFAGLRDGVEMIVSKNGLILNGSVVRAEGDVHELWRAMRILNVTAIYIPAWVTDISLWRFLAICASPPHQVQSAGGLDALLAVADCQGIWVQELTSASVPRPRPHPPGSAPSAPPDEAPTQQPGETTAPTEINPVGTVHPVETALEEERVYSRVTREIIRAFRPEGAVPAAKALLDGWRRIAVVQSGDPEAPLTLSQVSAMMARLEPLTRFAVLARLGESDEGRELGKRIADVPLAEAIVAAVLWKHRKGHEAIATVLRSARTTLQARRPVVQRAAKQLEDVGRADDRTWIKVLVDTVGV